MSLDPNQTNLDKVSGPSEAGEQTSVSEAKLAGHSAGRAGRKSVVREYAEAIIVAMLLAFAIRVLVVQAFKIPSGSMTPMVSARSALLR